MEKTVAKINVEFYERIEELREDFERVVNSSVVAYDSKFHMYATMKYRKLIEDIDDSDLDLGDKLIQLESIKQMFEELIDIVV